MNKLDESYKFYVAGNVNLLKEFISDQIQDNFSKSKIYNIPGTYVKLPYTHKGALSLIVCVYQRITKKVITDIVRMRKEAPDVKILILSEEHNFFKSRLFKDLRILVSFINELSRKKLTNLINSCLTNYDTSIDNIDYNAINNLAVNYNLSKKEGEILLLLQSGMSNKEIANVSNKAEATVKVQLKSIFRKMNITSRSSILTHTFS